MVAAPKKQDLGTRSRLIEAAERLFAERGFAAVSLREITREAETNVASVKYHFGSKEELITEVERRMTMPVNEERLSRLDTLEKNGVPDVRSILGAFIEPLVGQMDGNEQEQRLYSQFMARFFMERTQLLQDELRDQFQEIARRYVAAFSQVAPWLSPSQIVWRIDFSFGVFTNALLHRDILPQIMGKDVLNTEMRNLLEKVLDFCEAGFMTGKK